MSPKKKIKDSGPPSTSTDYDIEPIVTDSELNNSLRRELNAAINTMGPDTPHYFSDKPSDREELEAINNNSQALDIEWFQNGKKLEELYKADIKISLEESDSSSEIEVVENSFSSLKNESVLVSSKEVLLTPDIYRKKNREPSKSMKCGECGSKPPRNFASMRRSLLVNTNGVFNKSALMKWMKNRTSFEKKKSDECDFYKMCITKEEDGQSPPRKVVFNLVDELPKPKCTSKGVNTRHLLCQNVFHMRGEDGCRRKRERGRNCNEDDDEIEELGQITKERRRSRRTPESFTPDCHCGVPARVDVYYFDHGNAAYLRTTDNVPLIRTEIVADKSEEYNNKFWGEIFGSIHIGTSFVTCFILQLFRFILQGIIRPLTVGLLQLASDYFIKPFLATIFNALIQPPLICCYNICTSIRDICDPLAEGLGYFLKEIAVIFQACRFVEIRRTKSGKDQDYLKKIKDNEVKSEKEEKREDKQEDKVDNMMMI